MSADTDLNWASSRTVLTCARATSGNFPGFGAPMSVGAP
jgi:hypothetical protein